MPRLNKADLNKVRYTSMNDYIVKLNGIENLDDKIKFTARYLLTQSKVKNPDFSMEEAIHIARTKISAEISKSNAKDNINANQFITNPVGYLKNEAQTTFDELEKEDATMKYEDEMHDLCSYFIDNLDEKKLNDKLTEYRLKPEKSGINAKLINIIGSNGNLDSEYQAIKPGFIAKTFRTASRAFVNLNTVYSAFNNPKHALYGNVNALEKAAKEFMHHKIKGWKDDIEISDKTKDNLSKKDKASVNFSLNLLKAIKEQKTLNNIFDNALGASQKQHKVIDLEQEDFQKNVSKDTKEVFVEDKIDKINTNEIVNEKELDDIKDNNDMVMEKSND